MAPPIHLGAWSMALMLWLPFELLTYCEQALQSSELPFFNLYSVKFSSKYNATL